MKGTTSYNGIQVTDTELYTRLGYVNYRYLYLLSPDLYLEFPYCRLQDYYLDLKSEINYKGEYIYAILLEYRMTPEQFKYELVKRFTGEISQYKEINQLYEYNHRQEIDIVGWNYFVFIVVATIVWTMLIVAIIYLTILPCIRTN